MCALPWRLYLCRPSLAIKIRLIHHPLRLVRCLERFHFCFSLSLISLVAHFPPTIEPRTVFPAPLATTPQPFDARQPAFKPVATQWRRTHWSATPSAKTTLHPRINTFLAATLPVQADNRVAPQATTACRTTYANIHTVSSMGPVIIWLGVQIPHGVILAAHNNAVRIP